MRTILLVALLALAVPGAFSFAQVPESERTPITDPDVLESLGLPRDARNVYRAKRIDAGPPSETPDDWGSGAHFTAVTPEEFIGEHSSGIDPYEWGLTTWGLACEPPCIAQAKINLPTGVLIQAIRWWAYDSDANENLEVEVYEVCHPTFSAGPRTLTLLADGATTGSAGDQAGVLSGAGYTVNNRDCYYSALVVFNSGSMAIGKLRVQWSREVSPPPTVAAFGDVPTNHQFFQHIEALAASGITAGCGGGNFCPNNPVTRGQMAVFLSIALGLYFP